MVTTMHLGRGPHGARYQKNEARGADWSHKTEKHAEMCRSESSVSKRSSCKPAIKPIQTTAENVSNGYRVIIRYANSICS